eukprot:TRINITY_DN1184_c0_g1_i1.p1 TRINITY_DN1184_c0_g1~~TRINITY_DN1184_c0_g1_i1.p1  ORF type:complete len:121 (-),score=22.45 TRINITY_DN1184_c0_g1_i1:37-399(-)
MSLKCPITTHCLDTSRGHPANGMTIALEIFDSKDNTWVEMGQGQTNRDGRITNLLPFDHQLRAGIYRMVFHTSAYYATFNTKCFYPKVEVAFEIEEDKVNQHYHVPLLLNPYGYSTYRGS